MSASPDDYKNRVSVVINTYHTGPVLFRCIEAALAQEKLCQVIVVNNGNPRSTVDTLISLTKKHANLSLISGQGNIGFAGGCNLGVRAAKGEYLLLLNPDCVLAPHTLTQLITEYSAHPDVGMVGCRHMLPDSTIQRCNSRNLLSPKIALSQALKLYHFFPKRFPSLNLDEPDTLDTHAVPAISGALMFFNTQYYRDIGGLDEGYFFHVEDLDLCKRIHDDGKNILYAPSIQPTHYLSTSKVSSYFVEKHKTRGFHRYFRTHFKEKTSYLTYRLSLIGIYSRLYLRLPFMLLRKRKARKKSIREQNQLTRRADYLSTPLNTSYPLPKSTSFPSSLMINGASGQVGLAVIKYALAAKITCLAQFHKTIIHYENNNLHWIPHNHPTNTRTSPCTLIHCAPLWLLPDRLEQYHEMGITRIIAFSSSSIEGKASSTNQQEQDTVNKLRNAEHDVITFCTEHNITYTLLRPTMIYGIGLDANVNTLARIIKKTGFFPVTFPGTGKRAPVHVEDLALATLSCLTHNVTHNKTYTLSGGETLSYKTMVNRIGNALGRKKSAWTIPCLPLLFSMASCFIHKKELNAATAKRMNHDLDFSHDKATQDFDYIPRPFTPPFD